jgi:O-acetyl-ADP-ribose deacetylase (regulator of RNase III)
VGPVWRDGTSGEPETLARCYRNSLAVAASEGLASVAFPSISTGAYGYPVAEAAAVALRAVRDALHDGTYAGVVRFVLWSEADLETYSRALAQLEDLR